MHIEPHTGLCMTTTRFKKDKAAQIENVAEFQGISVSVLIRCAVDEYLVKLGDISRDTWR